MIIVTKYIIIHVGILKHLLPIQYIHLAFQYAFVNKLKVSKEC